MEIIQSYLLYFWDFSYHFYMALQCLISKSLLGICSTALHCTTVAGACDRPLTIFLFLRNFLFLSYPDDTRDWMLWWKVVLVQKLLFHSKPIKYTFSIILYSNGFGYNAKYIFIIINCSFFLSFFFFCHIYLMENNTL